MTTHLPRVGVLLVILTVGPGGAAEPAAVPEPTPAQRLWQQGQDALREGRPDDAIPLYERSLTLDPDLANNHLSLGAAYLDKGDDERARLHLQLYLEARPHHCIIRVHYAELLIRLHDLAGARRQYERFDADAQDQEELAATELVHCHSRLMEIAEQEGDDYAVHLHRGIGLYLLARQQESRPEEAEGFSSESLLCKAAGELALARLRRPDEARPCWYLFAVWSRLGQRQPAVRWLREAEAAAPFSGLTPAERRGMELAARDFDAERGRKSRQRRLLGGVVL